MPPKPAEIWGAFHRNDDKPNGSHHRATHWRCINSERHANAPIATRSLTWVLRRVLGMITAVNTEAGPGGGVGGAPCPLPHGRHAAHDWHHQCEECIRALRGRRGRFAEDGEERGVKNRASAPRTAPARRTHAGVAANPRGGVSDPTSPPLRGICGGTSGTALSQLHKYEGNLLRLEDVSLHRHETGEGACGRGGGGSISRSGYNRGRTAGGSTAGSGAVGRLAWSSIHN
ncbi:hypothetical protein C8J57DRAFT_1235647 [Mycena rebaudengoi]|nr:hypothetical protein C8J57DRAFT_1235647 [Mycena rebaudengoi]